MCLNRTSEWHVMTIWIIRELPFFNFEPPDISWASILHPCQKLWPSELDQSVRVEFRESRYIMCLNQTFELNVRTIWILENYHFSISSVSIYHLPQWYTHVKSYGRLNCTRAFVFNFENLDILCAWIGHPSEMLWPFEFLENLNVSILSVSIYPVSYTHLTLPTKA